MDGPPSAIKASNTAFNHAFSLNPRLRRFTQVAVRWAAGLLRGCDEAGHGVDMFGRDSLLLGRLLNCLGVFAESAAGTPASLPLSSGVLELLKAPAVHNHKEVRG
jgi:telomere length regulation protein